MTQKADNRPETLCSGIIYHLNASIRKKDTPDKKVYIKKIEAEKAADDKSTFVRNKNIRPLIDKCLNLDYNPFERRSV